MGYGSYWYNRTYFIVTDQPWHVPLLRLVASLSTDTDKPANGRVAVRLISIRNPSVSPASTQEENQLGESTSLESVVHRYGSAEVIEGPEVSENAS
jgi:protein O-GlcNAc transferase